MQLLDNAVLFMFLSFVIGLAGDAALQRTSVYNVLSHWFLFEHPQTYESVGVLWYRWFLAVTPFGSFNRDLYFTKRRDVHTLSAVRQKMCSAEISHWVGFLCLLALTFVAWWYRGIFIAFCYVFFNLIGNLYPCLLQQYNKRRLDRVINAAARRELNAYDKPTTAPPPFHSG